MTATAAAPTPEPQPRDELRRIPLAELHESPLNPRKHFEPHALEEIKDSLLAVGQLTPITVRPRKTGGYEIAAGHRRFRAAKLAVEQHADGARFRGLHELLAVVRDLEEAAFVEVLNIENLQRDDLHPLEEAEGFKTLIERARYDVKKIAARIGKSERYVYDSLTLLKLIPEAKKLFLEGRFERGHAVELARLAPDQQKELIDLDEASSGWRLRGLWQDEVYDNPPDPSGEQEDLDLDDQSKLKPVSVRELKTYINDHYRATPDTVDPFLFPDTVQLLTQAQAKKGRAAKIVHITYDHRVPDAARDPKIKTYGEQGWQRADGKFKSKPCDHSVVGLVVAGPGRGEAFLVCVNKEKCAVHWRDWQRERERRVKERVAIGRRAAKESNKTEGPSEKPDKPEPPQPDDACRQRVGDAIVADLYPGILKAVRTIVEKLAIPDDIIWNVTHTILDGDGLNDWAEPPKRPGYFGGALVDDAGIWERGVLPKLLRALPGEFAGEDYRHFKNAAGARSALAIEVYLVRDYDAQAIDKRFGKEVDAAWKAELKARAKAEAKKPQPSAKPTVKGKAKGKKR